jgi:SAM-dependent methyltransferase
MCDRLGFRYQTNELALFAQATNWKAYWASRISPFIKGDVLEVGAGLGANTAMLSSLSRGRYVCLEPDRELIQQLQQNFTFGSPLDAFNGGVASLSQEERFDTAIYIDVLEHIEDDAAELASVAKHIRPGGHIIVLGPACQALYSPFDEALGHYRRYNRSTLLRCSPPGSSVARIEYLDSLGGVLSLANRLILRQSYPTLSQVLFWDGLIVPVSRRIDRLTGFHIGKSILGIWRIPDLTLSHENGTQGHHYEH